MRSYRILIVDDESTTLEQAPKLLQEALELDSIVAAIDRAESIENAQHLIRFAAKADQPYDLAILDFKLPAKKGGHPNVDETLCREISERMPKAVVSHITGYAADAGIITHVSRYHDGWRKRGFCIDKRDADFGSKLVLETRRSLLSADIEARLQVLDGWGCGTATDFANRHPGPRVPGPTSNRVMGLCMDISIWWKYLTVPTRTLAKKYFDVDENLSPVRVTFR